MSKILRFYWLVCNFKLYPSAKISILPFKKTIWSLHIWMSIVKMRCFYEARDCKSLNNPQFVNTRLMHFLHLSFNVMLFRHMISKQSTFKLQNLFYHNQTAYCTVISAFIIFFSRYANVIFAIWQKWIFNFQVYAWLVFRQKMHKIKSYLI